MSNLEHSSPEVKEEFAEWRALQIAAIHSLMEKRLLEIGDRPVDYREQEGRIRLIPNVDAFPFSHLAERALPKTGYDKYIPVLKDVKDQDLDELFVDAVKHNLTPASLVTLLRPRCIQLLQNTTEHRGLFLPGVISRAEKSGRMWHMVFTPLMTESGRYKQGHRLELFSNEQLKQEVNDLPLAALFGSVGKIK